VLYALCGISRVGKTTVLKHLLQRQPLLKHLVTTTTRPPRAEEVNHVDYHFVTLQHFQTAVQANQIVCPIRYRGEWYGTTYEDLTTCTTKEVIAVLRPDKINELRQFVPLLGIYLSRPEENQSVSPDDQIIVAHQHLCSYHVVNIPGKLDQTVEYILGIIHSQAGD
jgi:guanylate kinase